MIHVRIMAMHIGRACSSFSVIDTIAVVDGVYSVVDVSFEHINGCMCSACHKRSRLGHGAIANLNTEKFIDAKRFADHSVWHACIPGLKSPTSRPYVCNVSNCSVFEWTCAALLHRPILYVILRFVSLQASSRSFPLQQRDGNISVSTTRTTQL
jgi:hypothetical protein